MYTIQNVHELPRGAVSRNKTGLLHIVHMGLITCALKTDVHRH